MYRYALSFPSARIPNLSWIQALQHTKVKRMEYACAPSCLDPQGNFSGKIAILTDLQAHGDLEVASIHIPFGNQWNPSVLEPALHDQNLQRMETFLKLCAPLNCRHFTFHGSHGPVEPQQRAAGIQQLKSALDRLLPLAQDHHLTLNLELLPKPCLGQSPEEILDIIEDYPPEYLGVCLDVNHLLAPPEQIPQAIQAMASRINTFHFSDYDGVNECHWYPFLGILPWDRIMAELKRLPQSPLIVLETDGFLRPPLWQKRKLDDAVVFAAAEHNIYLLEHADDIMQGRSNQLIP